MLKGCSFIVQLVLVNEVTYVETNERGTISNQLSHLNLEVPLWVTVSVESQRCRGKT